MIDIKGKELMENGNYDMLIIIERDGEYYIQFTGSKDEEVKTNKNDVSENYINNESKEKVEEQILGMVSKFLNDNKINFVENRNALRFYGGTFSLVNTMDKKTMILKMFDSSLEEIKQMTMDKFTTDRLEFCEENKDATSYEISAYDHSSYDCGYSTIGEKSLVKFDLLTIDDKIIYEERRFFKDFLWDRLNSVGEEAKFYEREAYNCLYPSQNGQKYGLVCGNITIQTFNSSVADVMDEVSREYNEELKTAKVKRK